MNDHVPPYNTDQSLWDNWAKQFRQQTDGGPVLKVLEGHVWGVPRLGNVARFETDEEAEKVLLAAGFKYVEASKGFRALPEGPQGPVCGLIGHQIAFVGFREDGSPIYRCDICYKSGASLRKLCASIPRDEMMHKY